VPFSSLAAEPGDGPTVDPDRFLGDDTRFPGHWAAPPQRWEGADRVLARETLDVIERVIATLPRAQAIVITMRDVEGFDGSAPSCGTSSSTATSSSTSARSWPRAAGWCGVERSGLRPCSTRSPPTSCGTHGCVSAPCRSSRGTSRTSSGSGRRGGSASAFAAARAAEVAEGPRAYDAERLRQARWLVERLGPDAG
jgi:hypothetical protein